MVDLKKQNYYKKNREARLEYQKEYYITNRAGISERLKKKRKDDPKWVKELKEYNREYYKKNKLRIIKQRSLK